MASTEDSKEDNHLQDIVVHLQQLLLADNVLSTHATEQKSKLSTSSDDYLDQLAPLIRDALSSNQVEELRSGIDAITKAKDQEIELLCNGNQNVSGNIRLIYLFKAISNTISFNRNICCRLKSWGLLFPMPIT